MRIAALTLLLGLAFTPATHATTGTPPIVDAVATAQADRVRNMPDNQPVARMNQLLAARELSQAALFSLAQSHPGLVEQLVDPRYRMAVQYISHLPAPDLGRIRRGETVIRSAGQLRGDERKIAIRLAESFEFKKFEPEKLKAMRVGPLDGRHFRVEVTARKKKKKKSKDLFQGEIELAWPSTPDRDERSRDRLARHFGARPSPMNNALGQQLPLKDGSFEDPEALGKSWQVVDGLMLGTNYPEGEVHIDGSSALDGLYSLRFHATERTRLFPEAIQQVPVTPGRHVRARCQVRAENLRVEFQQRETDVRMALAFLDATGARIGNPSVASARLSTHEWEPLELNAQAPPGATTAQVGLLSGVSGTAWFDGVALDLIQ